MYYVSTYWEEEEEVKEEEKKKGQSCGNTVEELRHNRLNSRRPPSGGIIGIHTGMKINATRFDYCGLPAGFSPILVLSYSDCHFKLGLDFSLGTDIWVE